MSTSAGRSRLVFCHAAGACCAAMLVVLSPARAEETATPQRAPAISRDARLLENLRRRRQFDEAEKYCREQLADRQSSDERRLELTIELARTHAAHALESNLDQQSARWEQARAVLDVFEREHPRDPQLLLIRVQRALTALAQGEAAREAAELAGGRKRDLTAARELVRDGIGQMRKLDQEIAEAIQRDAQRGRSAENGQLSREQLASLAMHVRHERARGLLSQALCYPPGSGDRINSLSQANELLVALAGALETPIEWSMRLDEVANLRLLEEFSSAERKLAALEKAMPPAYAAPQVRAERVRLALARGKIGEALSEAGGSSPRPKADWSPADLAALEAFIAGWQKAAERKDLQEAARWERAAVEQVRAIERAHGPATVRRAETLLARSLAASPQATSAEAQARAGGSFYRGGQIEPALAAYDRAVELARAAGDSNQAFEAALAAAAIEHERQHFQAAIDRYCRLAEAWPAHAKSATAHLLAIQAAAQRAATQKQPRLDEYERLLRAHVDRWPQSASASQAWWWLGRLKEQQHNLDAAITAWRHVQSAHGQYAAAVEALGRAYPALIAERRRAGASTVPLAKDALSYFEQVIGPREHATMAWNAASRAAAVAAARIALDELPGGAAKAEDLLRAALENSADAPRAWRTAAETLLVRGLAARGRIGEAHDAIERVPIGAPADALALADALAAERQRVEGSARRKLAALELAVLDDLLAKSESLDAATLHGARRRRALALGEAGRRAQAIAQLEALSKENPRDGQTAEDLAGVLSAASDQAGLSSAAAQWHEVAARSRPGSPRWLRAHYGLARVQLALGKPAEARATIERAEKVDRNFGGGDLKAEFERLGAECAK